MMRFVRWFRLLHVVVIERSSRPSIKPFLVNGHISGKHYILSIMRGSICGDVLQYLPWNLKKQFLYKCFSLTFLFQDHRSGFHVWGSLQRIEKAKIERGNTF